MAEKHLIVPSPGGTSCNCPCNTPLYQEESLEKGGAAVARMILGSQKVNLTPLPSQTDIYNYAHERNLATESTELWDIDPQGLCTTLNDKIPSTFDSYFMPCAALGNATGLSNANAWIIHTIDEYEVAPAVLVREGAQWVAVVGYRTDANGALTSIFLNDPRPPITDGTGDPPDFEVSAEIWSKKNYFSPVRGGTEWNGKYAMVIDPRLPQKSLPTVSERPLFDGREIIHPDEAVKAAIRQFEERGTAERPLFSHALESGQPTSPQLVQIIDQEDSFYYLIRWKKDNLDQMVVAIDARFGTFLEAIAYHSPFQFFKLEPSDIPSRFVEGLILGVKPETVRNRIINRLFRNVDLNRMSNGGGTEQIGMIIDQEIVRSRRTRALHQFRSQEIQVHPVMAWQMCAESSSLLYPFYVVNTPFDRFYTRAADGYIFDQPNIHPLLFLGG